MKQTPLAGLCFRQEPPPTEAVEWRTVRPPPPLAAKSSPRQSAPWGPTIIAAGLVVATLIVANGSKPAPPAEPKTISPSRRLLVKGVTLVTLTRGSSSGGAIKRAQITSYEICEKFKREAGLLADQG